MEKRERKNGVKLIFHQFDGHFKKYTIEVKGVSQIWIKGQVYV
jgi:hypothetical protein